MGDESCPQVEELRDCLLGRLPVETAEALLDHLDSCPRCQARLQTVSDVDDTLIECLRQPWVRDELQDEPQFREALARFRPAEPSGDETTRSGQTMGTLEYMSPEQASDTHSVDVRADVYGLGCTLHYLLIGRAPYAGETAYQILRAHHESPIPSLRAERPDVPERLDRVFQKMVAKTPAERHASMTEVIADLEECLAEAEEHERTADLSGAPAAGPQPKRRKRRVVALVVVGAVTAMVLLAGLILKLKTPQGTLIFQVDQQDAEVVIDHGKITITTPGDPEPTEIRLKEGEHTLTVSKGGFQTRTETFTIESGSREVLNITLVPLASGAERAEVEPPRPSDAAAWAAILPADAPPPAVAPFDAATAKKHQQAWADYLGLPVEREVDLPGGEKLTLVLIPPGEFLMGSTAEEQARFLEEAKAVDDQAAIDRIPSEGPQHRVRITRPFYLGKYEVTQAQWEAVMGNKPSYFADEPSHPVEHVSWDNIQAFLAKLNESRNRQGMIFALPTEAQWEHACRAGTTTFWHCGQSKAVLQQYGWFVANSGSRTHPVGQLRPNAFGLYDMHGNVWEWCADWYAADYYAQSPIDDPSGSPTGSGRVFRGGSWYLGARFCRSARREPLSPDGGSNSLGVRLASVLVDE